MRHRVSPTVSLPVCYPAVGGGYPGRRHLLTDLLIRRGQSGPPTRFYTYTAIRNNGSLVVFRKCLSGPPVWSICKETGTLTVRALSPGKDSRILAPLHYSLLLCYDSGIEQMVIKRKKK